MAGLHDLSALDQAAAIRSGLTSPTELVEHYLGRVAALSDTVGAFVTVLDDAARSEARAATQRVTTARKEGTAAALPPLFGVPTAIKDLNLTRGVPTKLGSLAFADFVPSVDDHVVTLLRAAGTISLGKTNTPELGAPCYTEPDPSIAPPARTPWDLTCSAGGSSGGAGAAVAAGLVPFAQGSDGGGSIRIPASLNGLVGVKVSRGRVSNGPVSGDLTGLAWSGPLARTVADAAAMLDAMAVVPQPGDPHWAPPLPAGQTFLGHAVAGLRGRVRPLRVGRYLDNVLGAPVHQDCRAAWGEASSRLAALGHEVVDVPTPELGGLFASFMVLWGVAFAAVPVAPDREDLLRPLTRMLRERGKATSATAFAAAIGAVQFATRGHIAATAGYDVVLTPTLAQPSLPVGALRDDDDPAEDLRRQGLFTPYTAVYNVTGQPAVSLPLHVSDSGRPIGVQLVGRPGDEATLFRLAGQLEAAHPWSHRHPDLW